MKYTKTIAILFIHIARGSKLISAVENQHHNDLQGEVN